jgi:cysteine desulfurase
VTRRCSHPGCHIVTTAFEHYVVPKNIAQFLEPAGHSVTVVPVLPNGLVDMEAFTAALTPDTRMVSVMLVQNETGIVQPIREICDAAHQVGALVHVDACQAAGKIPINVVDLGADLLSIAGHKFSGPPGTGALFVRRGLEIQPLIVGAMQQGGRRAGTEAVMNCAAMGVACLEAQKWLSGNGPFFQRGIRGRVVQFIKKWCRDNSVAVVFHGEDSPVVPTVIALASLFKPCCFLPLPVVSTQILQVISVAFPGVVSHQVQHALKDEVAFSVGAACNSGKVSATLSAMGVPRDVALGTCRISFGKDTTEDYIERGVLKIMEACKALLSSK